MAPQATVTPTHPLISFPRRTHHQIYAGLSARFVVWSASRPCSLSSSSTSRNESEYRRVQRTAQRISSGSVCRHLKIAGRIAFFMISSGYQPRWPKLQHIRRMQPWSRIRVSDGSQEDDGIYLLFKEVVDNSVDEFLMGAGRKIDVATLKLSRRAEGYGPRQGAGEEQRALGADES